MFNKIFYYIKKPYGKIQFTLSLILGFSFICSSLRIIFSNGFMEEPFALLIAILIGVFSLHNAFSILRSKL